MSRSRLFRITTVPQSLKRLLEGQHRFMMAHGFDVIGVASEGPDLREVAKNEGIRVIPVEMTRTISPIKDFIAVWKLYKIFRREHPLIVHTHTPKAGTVGMLAAWLAGVPNRLHTVAGLPLVEVKGMKRCLLDVVEKITYALATRVYPNSKGQYDFILRYFRPKSTKIKVIANGSSNGVNTTYFDPVIYDQVPNTKLRNSLGIGPNDFIFVYVGRMVKDKGVNELINAYVQLQESLPGLGEVRKPRLLLVGKFESELDPLLPETEKIIKSNPDIFYIGYQQDVRPYFAISDCLVFPSYREGFPNVVMQAGAMGLPSIVSDINGCNEIIENGINGLIIPPKQTQALHGAMMEILRDERLYIGLQEKSREMIVSRYEQVVVWNALLNEYQRLIEPEDMEDI